MRRNNILRKYYNDKRMEFDKDPVQFVINNNDEIKAFFALLSIPLSLILSLRFAVSGEQLLVVTQFV
jgi:hypothetical protein